MNTGVSLTGVGESHPSSVLPPKKFTYISRTFFEQLFTRTRVYGFEFNGIFVLPRAPLFNIAMFIATDLL